MSLYVAVIWLSPGWINGVRLVKDNVDRSFYFNRGAFVVRDIVPYSPEHVVEYPQLAVYFFAVPHLIATLSGKTETPPQPGISDEYRDIAAGTINPSPYQDFTLNIFSTLMAVFFVLLFAVTLALLEGCGESIWRGAIFFMPAFMYFSLNRYDLFPALIVSLAVLSLSRDRFALAFGLLGLGAMAKWYPILFLPLFVSYTINAKDFRYAARLTAVFVGVIILMLLPTLATTGIDGILKPYTFQFGRKSDPLALLYYIEGVLGKGSSVKLVLMALGLTPPVVGFIMGVKTFDGLVRWMSLTVACFMLVQSFYSPQWLIWLTPLVILWCSKPQLMLLVALDVASYLLFPLLFDFLGVMENPLNGGFALVVFVKSVILGSIAILSMQNIKQQDVNA